jgi:ribosomal subunit interface protein
MLIPVEVSFRHMAQSDAIEEEVRRKAEKLDRFYPRITGCRVVVEASNRRTSTKAMLYRVRVEVIVPGGEIVAERQPSHQPLHDDIHVAIRDAFDSMKRELQDYADKQRGDVKVHELPPRGRVVRIFPDRGYGFLESDDGYEVYFHHNAVVDGAFGKLAVGDEVRFEEDEGEQGPQATSVIVVGRAA